MSLRRLHPEQPDSFAFTETNREWAERQLTKFPEGRQASAIIPLLWRAQEQEGWLTKPAIEYVADMLDMTPIRALEVATFYYMFQLQPVGSVAHIQICGTTSCMICGAEDLIGVCREKIAAEPHQLSADGKLSWEEVECLGACSNAPMCQIGKDYYEDLTAERLGEIIDMLVRGDVPAPGPQNGRFASEPRDGRTSLEGERDEDVNASMWIARELDDTIGRIRDGHELIPRDFPMADRGRPRTPPPEEETPDGSDRYVSDPAADAMAEEADVGGGQSDVPIEGVGGGATEIAASSGRDGDERPAFEGIEAEPASRLQPGGIRADAPAGAAPGGGEPMGGAAPERLEKPQGEADDLQQIKGIGPRIAEELNAAGIWHFWQIAAWTGEEIRWIETRMGFPGRVERDDWIGQARQKMSRDG